MLFRTKSGKGEAGMFGGMTYVGRGFIDVFDLGV